MSQPIYKQKKEADPKTNSPNQKDQLLHKQESTDTVRQTSCIIKVDHKIDSENHNATKMSNLIPTPVPSAAQLQDATTSEGSSQKVRRRRKRKVVEPPPSVERSNEGVWSQKRVLIIIAIMTVILLAIGGGLAAYFLTEEVEEDFEINTIPTTLATTVGPTPASTGTDVLTLQSYTEEKWRKIRGKCGASKVKQSLNARIVGGEEAVEHSWPWQIGLLKYKDYGGGKASVKHICGGTLIGPKYVISAVHCFLNSGRTHVSTVAGNYRVLVGGHKKAKKDGGAEYKKIKKLNHHPHNNLATFSIKKQVPVFDITLILLEDVVDPNAEEPAVEFACLPRPQFIPEPGKKCWATGWGKTMGTGNANELKQVPQPLVSEETCRKKYASKQISDDKHICGGPHKGAEGTCQGDSGGPLVCEENKDEWSVHGATSFGPQPCGTNPSVWAQVSYFIDWICCFMTDHGPCLELMDELPMIYGTAVFLYAMANNTREKGTINKGYVVAMVILCIVITVVYLHWKDPIFHQVCYSLMVAVLLYESILTCRRQPQAIPLALLSTVLYACGIIVWILDNEYCGHLKIFRTSVHPGLHMITQFHGLWHLFTGTATNLHILMSAYARSLQLKKKCSIKIHRNILPYLAHHSDEKEK